MKIENNNNVESKILVNGIHDLCILACAGGCIIADGTVTVFVKRVVV